MNEMMEKIIDAATHELDIAEFGQRVAEILLVHGAIDEAVYDTLTDGTGTKGETA